jgi:hypothetical protein
MFHLKLLGQGIEQDCSPIKTEWLGYLKELEKEKEPIPTDVLVDTGSMLVTFGS